jgi:hypothetical protein
MGSKNSGENRSDKVAKDIEKATSQVSQGTRMHGTAEQVDKAMRNELSKGQKTNVAGLRSKFNSFNRSGLDPSQVSHLSGNVKSLNKLGSTGTLDNVFGDSYQNTTYGTLSPKEIREIGLERDNIAASKDYTPEIESFNRALGLSPGLGLGIMQGLKLNLTNPEAMRSYANTRNLAKNAMNFSPFGNIAKGLSNRFFGTNFKPMQMEDMPTGYIDPRTSSLFGPVGMSPLQMETYSPDFIADRMFEQQNFGLTPYENFDDELDPEPGYNITDAIKDVKKTYGVDLEAPNDAYNANVIFNQLGSQPASQYSVLNDYDAEQDAINQMALADRLSLADMGFEGYMQESPFPGQALTNPEDIAFRENFINEQNAAENSLGFKMDDLVDLRNINYDPSILSNQMGYFRPSTNKIGLGMTKPGTFNVENAQAGYSPFNTVLHEGLHSLFKDTVPSGVEEFVNRQATTSVFPPGSEDDLNSINQFSGYNLDDPSLSYMDEPDYSQYNQGLSAANLPNNQQLFRSFNRAGFNPTDAFKDRFDQQPNTEDSIPTQGLNLAKSIFGFNQGGLIPPMSGPMSNGLGNLFKMK